MSELFAQLTDETRQLAFELERLQRIRLLMQACQITSLPVAGRRLEWQPSGLIITGTDTEGMMIVVDHPRFMGPAPRRCRVCQCTDNHACLSLDGPCHWRVKYEDNTGLCSHCDDRGPQPPLFPHTAGDAGEGHSHG